SPDVGFRYVTETDIWGVIPEIQSSGNAVSRPLRAGPTRLVNARRQGRIYFSGNTFRVAGVLVIRGFLDSYLPPMIGMIPGKLYLDRPSSSPRRWLRGQVTGLTLRQVTRPAGKEERKQLRPIVGRTDCLGRCSESWIYLPFFAIINLLL